MINISMIYCSCCKKVGGHLILKSKSVRKTGTRHYYNCMDCNNRRRGEYYKKNGDKCRNILKKSQGKNKKKQWARIEVKKAVERGDLVRPSSCQNCNLEHGRMEGHHHDYGKPMQVRWLCSLCHKKEHKKML